MNYKIKNVLLVISFLLIFIFLFFISSNYIFLPRDNPTFIPTVSFKSTAASIQPELVLCCNDTDLNDPVFPGDAICDKGEGNKGYYPPDTNIGSITVIDGDCDLDGTFEIRVTPESNYKGSCASAVITESRVTFTGC